MSGSIDSKSSNGSQNQSAQGATTTNPLLSQDWFKSFGRASGNVNGAGYTPGQQTGMDWFNNNLTNNPVAGATSTANTGLDNVNQTLGSVNNRFVGPAMSADALQSAGAPQVGAMSGADFISRYAAPTQGLIDSTINDANVNADRGLNTLRAGRDAAGAFGDRSSLADASFLGDSARGLTNSIANIRLGGYNTAVSAGQGDANRFQTADEANASNTLNNNQFNVGAGYQNRANQAAATNQLTSILGQQGALGQQQLNNINSLNGADAQTAGTISNMGSNGQSQLMALIQAAMAGNGSQSSTNASGASNTNASSKGGDLGAGVK